MSNTFECSVNVIPLIKTDSKYISLIQEAMQDVIPYIETLTQVRYYPVTTYIVDKFFLKKDMVLQVKIMTILIINSL